MTNYRHLPWRSDVAALIGIAALSICADADPVFTNLALGQYYNTGTGFPVTGNGVANGRKGIVFGVQFTPTGNYTFTDARLALGLLEGANSVDVYLESNCSGVPCNAIEQWALNDALKTGSSSLVTVNSTSAPVLHSGTPYWLVLTAGAPDTVAFWLANLANDFATSSDFVVAFSGGPWRPYDVGSLRPAFEIDGRSLSGSTPPPQTPEPSSLLLVVVGVVAAAALKTAKKLRGLHG